jgi:cytochrome c oxidase assembly protein subunit 15
MSRGKKFDGFAKYAIFVLVWNLVVILWGVFLRASKSGDGCGQHWLTCQGEVIPSAPELKTVIEYSHRATSTLAGILVIGLFVWAYLRRRGGAENSFTALYMAAGSLVFIVAEGLLGAGLVLTGNTAENLTPERPFWMAGHLINTFILLAFLTLTARAASGARRPFFSVDGRFKAALATGILAVFIVGVTGSLAALASMIFPSGTLAEGLIKDFSATSNMLLRLRLLHPITAILASVFLVFLTGWLAKASDDDPSVRRWSNTVSLLVLGQIAFGAATLLMLAPIVMQLGHLLLADLIWISYVMMAANFLAARPSIVPAAPLTASLDEAVE